MGDALQREPFPRIIRFIGSTDSPDSSCPHCGATGRFILYFMVEDGRRLGAMRGCAKLFPASRIAIEELRLTEKLKRLVKSYGGTARLNQNDRRAAEAIEGFYAGSMSEQQALGIVDGAKAANSARYRRRR